MRGLSGWCALRRIKISEAKYMINSNDSSACPSGVRYGAKKSGENRNTRARVYSEITVTCRTTTYGLDRSTSIARRPLSCA